MAEKSGSIATCVVHGKKAEIQHSLRLTRDKKGSWKSNPVCSDCRRTLIRDAKVAGRFIPFFGIEASEKEAAKRNDQFALNRPFLEKFGRVREENPKQKKSAKVTPLRKATG